MEYVDLKDNNSSDHDNSISSDNNRGVYRSAGNYQLNNGSDNAASLGYIPQNSSNKLADSRQSGDIYLNKNTNRPLVQSTYQRESSSVRSSTRLASP